MEQVEKNKIIFLHIPKTGGRFLQKFLYHHTKKIRRNYFLSFTGFDDSAHFNDEHSTKRKHGNKCLIETIHNRPEIVDMYNNSPHFKQSKLLMGHTTYSFGRLFPEYNFNYVTVIREPIIRTLSNILQFTTSKNGKVYFGRNSDNLIVGTNKYWDFMYEIIKNQYPIKGFMIHENLFLRNIQTRILQGSEFSSYDEILNLDIAVENSKNIKYSFFDDFNKGLQKSFDFYKIPINMSLNEIAEKGLPKTQENKQNKLGMYYGADKKMVDLIRQLNDIDIKLYNKLKVRY